MARPSLETRIHAAWPVALPLAAVGALWISREIWTSTEPGFVPRGYDAWYALFWSAFAVTAWSSIVVLLSGARRWMRTHSAALGWASEGVFLFYVLHQTVITLVAYRVVRWQAGVLAEFSVIAAGSLAVTLLLVELARRWPVTRTLFGLNRR